MVSRLFPALVDAQRHNLPLWIPVLLAFGIGAYFSIPVEPLPWMLASIAGVLAFGLASLIRVDVFARIVLLAALIPLLGYEIAGLRSLSVAAPVLSFPKMANTEGRIIGLDRSASDRPRILLDQVIIHGLDPAATPERVRISLEPGHETDMLIPGQRVIGYARLSPPAAPSEPGGFDFRRLAWFQSLGAVGYARTPFLERDMVISGGWRRFVFSARLSLSQEIQKLIPGPNGGFAAAILSGDRSAVDQDALNDLRRTNLAHLLAISGLHMGLLTAFVFGLVRLGLALTPGVALRYPIKKIAAVAALAAGAAYLALSGANIATQRAFIMTAVVLIAVLLDRPAFTLRSVALAATLILFFRPESLLEAGFQMSFAASTALIAVFEWLRGNLWWQSLQGQKWQFIRPVIGVAVTSFVAGMATAPISAFHFNVISHYGLIANILAVPAMALLVMPAAVVAAILSLAGMAAPAMWVMGLGIEYILQVARFVSGLDGAVRAVPAGNTISLVLIAFGGVFAIIWLGRAKLAGAALICAGIILWTNVERPEILVSDNGRMFGIQSGFGRVVSSERGNSFAARTWLENDGDLARQTESFARPGMARKRGRAEMQVSGLGKFVYFGSKAPRPGQEAECRVSAIVLAPGWKSSPGGGCIFIGARMLRREGALAITIADGKASIDGAKSRNRSRPWTRDTTFLKKKRRAIASAK